MSTARGRRRRRETDVPFEALVTGLARGVADAQRELDRNTAALAEELAAEEVSVVPSVTRRVETDGSVSYESAPPTPRSLLELGFAPTRYQFDEARVDVEFDLKLRESETSETALDAGTADLRRERRLGREVSATARLSATLVPTPTPPGVEPARPDEP